MMSKILQKPFQEHN